METIKKATEVLAPETVAKENIQVNPTPEQKENQIPDEILLELAQMQRRFKEIYSGYWLCGIGDDGVQITAQKFLDTFDDYEVKDREDNRYSERLAAKFNGVRFFCIR